MICVFTVYSLCFPYILYPANYTAGDFGAGVACRLGAEIVRHTMNYHSSTEGVGYIKAVDRHRHIGVSVTVHEWR